MTDEESIRNERKKAAQKLRRRQSGLQVHKWTPIELQSLIDRYQHEGSVKLSAELGISAKKICARAGKLGLHCDESVLKARARIMQTAKATNKRGAAFVKEPTFWIAKRGCGPAHLPGEPVITDQTRITVCPSFKASPFRTNTWSTI